LLRNYTFPFKIAALIAFSVFLCFSATAIEPTSANVGSITVANYYPNDGGKYEFVDHFLKQTTAVNTNTTISVSIDGGAPILMAYQGIVNETVPGDTESRSWYTWQVTIPALTEPGTHTFQFFEDYYVWQDGSHYWADFNSQSSIKSFTILHPSPIPSQPTPNSSDLYALPFSQIPSSEGKLSPFSHMEELHKIAATIIMINIVAVAFLIKKKPKSN